MLRLHPYTYHRPSRVDEAIGLLGEYAGDALAIAGGTDLVPNMKHRLFTPGHLVALRGIDAMRGIGRDNGHLRIGAAESLAAVAGDPQVSGAIPMLARSAELVSGPQLRRMGTLGGNICLDTRCTYYNQTLFWRKALGFCLKKDGEDCHVVRGGTRCVAAHSADTPPALMVLNAVLEIEGPAGSRSVPIDGFFTSDGIWNRKLEPDELVISVRVPLPERAAFGSFQKLRARAAIDFPVVNLAVGATLDERGGVESIQMVASALGSYPRRIGGLDGVAVGKPLTSAVIDAVAEQAFRQCRPLPNITTDTEWRRAMVPVLVRRALRDILDQAGA